MDLLDDNKYIGCYGRMALGAPGSPIGTFPPLSCPLRFFMWRLRYRVIPEKRVELSSSQQESPDLSQHRVGPQT